MHKKIILLCLGDVIQASGKYCDLKKKKRNPNRQYILMVQSITRCSRDLQLKASNWETLLNLKLRFN